MSAHYLPVFFVIHLYVILIVFSHRRQYLASALSQQSPESGSEDKDVSHAKDTQQYRLSAGKKYFAAVDKYDTNSWRDPHSMFDIDDISSVYDVKLPRDSESEENGQPAHSEDPTGEAKFPNYPALLAKADQCKVSEYVYISRWLKIFLRRMNYSPDMDTNQIQIVQLYVDNRDLHAISKLLDSKEQKDIKNIDDVLSSFNEQFYILPPDSVWFIDVLHFIKDNLVLVFTVLVCMVSLWYLHVLYHNGLSIKLVLILVCVASFIWTWIHMYQKEIAKKEATLHSLGYPKECQENEMGYFNRLVVYWQRKLVEVEDKCLKYYEVQLVDPFWKVSPLMVASETASNFVLQPLGAVATHSNIFIKKLFGDMPLTLTLPTLMFGLFLGYHFFLWLRNLAVRQPTGLSHFHLQAPTLSNTSRNRVQPSIGETGCCGSGDCVHTAPHDYIQQTDADSRFVEVLELSTDDSENEPQDCLLDSENEPQDSGNALSGAFISSKASLHTSKMNLKDQGSQTS